MARFVDAREDESQPVPPHDEEKLRPAFAELEHSELLRDGASQHDVDGYEAADPSYMAVGASIRYWTKYHPEEVIP